MWPTVVAASQHCRGRCKPAPLAAEVQLGATQVSLADRVLSGSGVPAGLDGGGMTPTLRLSATGRTLGLDKPVVVSWQIHYLWLTPWHLALGGLIGGVDGDVGRVASLGGQSLGSTLQGLVIGPELAAVLARGPLEVRAGFAFGYRSVGLPVTSFAKVPCGKGGRCYPTISDDQAFFEPRVVVALHTGLLTFGAYAGGDLTGGGGWSTGGVVGIALPEWHARAQLGR